MKFLSSLITICLLLIFYNSQLYGQQSVSEYDIHLKSGLNFNLSSKDIEVIATTADSGSEFVIFAASAKNIIGIAYNDQFEVIKTLKFDKPEGFKKIIGAYHKNDSYILVSKAKGNIVLSLDFNFHSGDINLYHTELPKKERFVTTISENNDFILFTTSSKEPSFINAYNFKGADQFDRIPFSFNKIQFRNDLHSIHYILKEANLNQIPCSVPSNLAITHGKYKIYFSGGVIKISIDNISNYTEVLSMNLKSKQSDQSRYFKYVPTDEMVSVSANSLIHGNRIYQLIVTSNDLNLIISDLETAKTVASYSADKEDGISFANTPLVQEGGGTEYSKNRNFEIEKAKKFFSKVSKSNAALVVEDYDDEHIKITLGSYKDLYTASGTGGYMQGFSTPTPYGTVTSPSSYYPGYNFASDSWSKSTYFSTLLTKKDLQHQPQTLRESISSRIAKYKRELKKEFPAEATFTLKDKYYLSYYDKSKKVYKIIEFEE